MLGPRGASSRPHFQEAGGLLSIPCLGTALALGQLQGDLSKTTRGMQEGLAAPAGPVARHCGCTRGDSGHFCTLLHPISGQPGGGSPGGHQPRGRTCPAVGEGHVWAQVCEAPLRQGHVGASAFSADYRAGQLLPQESHPSQHSCLSSASPTRGSVGQERWHSPTSPLPGAAGTLWGPESG